MNIPKKLTEVDQALKTESEKLVKLLASGMFSADSFGNLTDTIANLKGQRDALDFIVHRHINESSDESIVSEMTDKILRGADDAWSGRGNEVRRSHFDGYRSIAQAFRDSLRFAK